MIRKLLATTALTLVFTGGAMAASTNATTNTMQLFSGTPKTAPEQNTNGYFKPLQGQVLASWLIGKPIYTKPDTAGAAMNANAGSNANGSQQANDNSQSTDNKQANNGQDKSGNGPQQIGDVNDVALSADGKVRALVVGVGGFLGIGEKNVAVDVSQVTWANADGKMRLYVSTTKDALNAAPAYNTDKLHKQFVSQGPKTGNGNSGNMQMSSDTGGQNANSGQNAMSKDNGQQATAMANANGNMASGQKMAKSNNQSMSADQSKSSSNSQASADVQSAEKLIGTPVTGPNDKQLGKIGDVIVGKSEKTVKAYIVDVGGFLGIGSKPVALAADSLDISQGSNGNVNVNAPFTKKQLNNQPKYTAKAYQKNPDKIVLDNKS